MDTPDFNPAALAAAARRRLRSRRGFSMLEVEIAFVLFALTLAGVGPLMVMYTKQLRSLQGRFAPQTTYYLIPSSDLWARKLGAAASVSTTNTSTSPAPPGTPANDVQIQSVIKSLDGDVVTANVTAVAS